MRQTSEDCVLDARAAVRTNLFLAAMLHFAGAPHPIQIRDLSVGGARVDSKQLPDVGTAVTLVRGRLRVEAEVTWSAGQSCGLRFHSEVSVSEWMTHPIILERQRPGPRSGASVKGVPADHAMGIGVGLDLLRVSRLLERLHEALAGDAVMLKRHGIQLEDLGVGARTLLGLAEGIQTGASERAASKARSAKLASQCSPI